MDGALAGRRAIVIGGGSGIGLGAARRLARDGAVVTIAGRTEARLRDAAADLARVGADVAWAVCDALDSDAVRTAVEAAADDEGRIDIAVTVPGGGNIKPVLLFDSDEFCADVDLNVRPVFNLLKWAGHAMVRNGSGSFVAISAAAAVYTTRYLSAYAAGKAAVDHLVRVAADELGPLGIRVNGVRPGLVRTPATAEAFADARMVGTVVGGQPIGRPGEVDDVAEAVRYLAGPESSWVTGQLLTVDGGHTLRAFIDYSTVIPMPDVRAAILGTGDAPRGP